MPMPPDSVAKATEQSAASGDGRLLGVAAGVAAVAGLLFGYDTGIISTALLSITQDFHLSSQGKELVTSSILAGAIVGALVSARLSERRGRKFAAVLVGVVFAIGTVGSALAPDVEILIGSRLVLGLAVGGSSQVIPIYIAEIAPASRRGRLVVMYQVLIAAGVLVSAVVGYTTHSSWSWRWMVAVAVIPALLLVAATAFLPESPRWLVAHGQPERARNVLRRLRTSPEEAEAELREVSALPEQGKRKEKLSARWLRPALLAGLGVALFAQVTGINAIVYYAPTFLSESGFGESTALLGTVGVGAVETLMVILGAMTVDRIGRRRLMLWTLPGSALSLVVMGAASLAGNAGWAVMLFMLLYMAFNSLGMQVVAWLMGSELFPLPVRGKAMSAHATTLWGADLLVSMTTLTLVDSISLTGMLWVYAALNVAAIVFVVFRVPETTGRSLEQIESSLRDGTFVPRGNEGVE
ncbi:sugar porter family MFS transporter [Streptomyces sp. NBC_00963]|uniref:sugar porter family MFS transporter n=1 Tax=Streptomyces sp. NBC_00963 TaxID=2903697 RepID=UPI0038630F02|nr:sugar porter family MFS transporter [Streptomyces sp. NBC_00963]